MFGPVRVLGIAIHRRTNQRLDPVITDEEGPLAADATFRGVLYVHLIEDAKDEEIPDGERDEHLVRSLRELMRRHPHRQVLLHEWQIDSDRFPRFSVLCEVSGVKSSWARARLW